jgi:hypothetical protein
MSSNGARYQALTGRPAANYFSAVRQMTDSRLQRMRLETLRSLLQGFLHFVIPQTPNIIHKYTRPWFSSGQRKVQFCTLLQVPIRLYGDSRNLNSFAASLYLQQAIKCSRVALLCVRPCARVFAVYCIISYNDISLWYTFLLCSE